MKEEDKQLFKEMIAEAVEPAIKKYVNGKIDNLTTMVNAQNVKIDAHIEKVEPYMEAANAAKLLSGFLKWLLGGLFALGSFGLLVKQLFFQP